MKFTTHLNLENVWSFTSTSPSCGDYSLVTGKLLFSSACKENVRCTSGIQNIFASIMHIPDCLDVNYFYVNINIAYVIATGMSY
jgi:hypothetical protein